MSPFFSNKRLIVLLVSLIILVALIGYSMRDREGSIWPEQFIRDTAGWFQSIMYKPAHMAAGFFENIENIKDVYEQNKVLKAQLDEYAKLAEKVKRLEKRNAELEDVLGKLDDPDLSDYNIRHAHVIARSPDRWNQQVTINKGSKDGVKRNMAVITAEGMIGKVSSVNPFSSTVQLMSDPGRTNMISAVIYGEKDEQNINGTISGYDTEKQALLLKMIPYDVALKEGQTVVTSGLGSVFPEGLIIGKVQDVSPDPQGLTQIAYVQPAADLNDFYDVMVVEREAPSLNGEASEH